jgi:hypothetical protein
MSAVSKFVKKEKVCVGCKGDVRPDPYDEPCTTQCGHKLCSMRCYSKLKRAAENNVGVPKHHCPVCNKPHFALHLVGDSMCRYPTAFEMDIYGNEDFASNSLKASVRNAVKVLEDDNFTITEIIAILLQKQCDTCLNIDHEKRLNIPYSLARVRKLQDTLDRVKL